MKKEANVHMLPTEDITNIVVFNDDLYLNNGYIEEDDQYLLGDATSNSHQEPKSAFEFQHLYFTTDEKIKEGDHFYNPATNEILFASKEMLSWNSDTTQEHKGWRKIISSTDPKLKLCKQIDVCGKSLSGKCICPDTVPQIPQSFIEEYCNQGGIDKVDVEYWIVEKEYSITKKREIEIKVDSNNCIIIHPVEEKMYSKEEVIKMFWDCHGGVLDQDQIKWIKENL